MQTIELNTDSLSLCNFGGIKSHSSTIYFLILAFHDSGREHYQTFFLLTLDCKGDTI